MKKPTEQKSIFKNKAELSFISRVDPALNLTIEENNGVFSIFDKRGELTSITKTDQTGACKYIKAALIEQATEDLKSNIKNKVNCVNKCNLALIQARAKVGAYLSGTRYKLKDNGDLYAKDQKAIDLILNEIRVKNNLQMFRTAIDSGCLRVKLMTHYKISKDRYVTHEDRALKHNN